MTDYELQAKMFLKETNSKMTITRSELIDRFPGDKTATGNRWSYTVKIRRNGMSFQTIFYESINNYIENKRPSQYDILACLQKYEVADDIWDFAQEYGYEIHCKTDYNSVAKTHKACKREYEKLYRMYADVWEKFQEIQ